MGTTWQLSRSLHHSSPPTVLLSEARHPRPFHYSGGCARAGRTACGAPERVTIACLVAAGAGHCLPRVSGVEGRGALSEQLAAAACSLGTRSRPAFWVLFRPSRARAKAGGPSPALRCERSMEICCLSSCTSPASPHFLAWMGGMEGPSEPVHFLFPLHFPSWELRRGHRSLWPHSIPLGGWPRVSAEKPARPSAGKWWGSGVLAGSRSRGRGVESQDTQEQEPAGYGDSALEDVACQPGRGQAGDDMVATIIAIITLTDMHGTMCTERAGCFVGHVWGQPRPSLKPLLDACPVGCSRWSSVLTPKLKATALINLCCFLSC